MEFLSFSLNLCFSKDTQEKQGYGYGLIHNILNRSQSPSTLYCEDVWYEISFSIFIKFGFIIHLIPNMYLNARVDGRA